MTRHASVSKKGRVLVIFDVPRPYDFDHDYTSDLKTKEWETEADVVWALGKLGYETDLLGIYDNTDFIRRKIEQFKPDVVFNLAEAFKGDTSFDQNIASLLELHDVPFTGCGPVGLMICKNKGISKQILSFHKIRVPRFSILHKNMPVSRSRHLGFPVFIKPLREEASYGISQASFVEGDDQFKERVIFIHESMGQDVIAEEYIEGRELYVSVFGNRRLFVGPIRELKFREVPPEEPKFASFKAKWDEDYRKRWGISSGFCDPLAEGLAEKIKHVCKKIYRLLSITGYARLDLRLTPHGEIVFIEANPNPILTSDEDFAESAKKADIPYERLIQKIINLGESSYKKR